MAKKMQKNSKVKYQRKRGMSVIMIIGVLLAVLFLPTTIILGIGMMPTLVLLVIYMGRRKSKVITVGAMNFSGCSPYVFELWFSGQDIVNSLTILMDPKAIIVMYSAALVGYAIDWGLTEIVSGVMREKAKAQLKSMRKRQSELVDRWGETVRGASALDKGGLSLKK